eukprot:1420043-Rhodomonas_salina.1
MFEHVGPKLVDQGVVVVSEEALIGCLRRKQRLVERAVCTSINAIGAGRVREPGFAAVHQTNSH